MKYLLFPLRLVWRIWFYILILVTILIMSPFLFVFTAKETSYPVFWKFARVWAYIVFYGTGFRMQKTILQDIESDKNYMFCPNHASFLDVFILVILSKNPIVFVGKKELEKIPIFGFFYKRACIVVDRNDPVSRKSVFENANRRLNQGVSIAIFPEGLVPEEHIVLAPFKNGAFSLAIDHQIPIVPQVYFDAKRLFSWDFFKGHPGLVRVKQLPFVETRGLTVEDRNSLKQTIYSIIDQELRNDKMYIKDTLSVN